MRAFVLALFVAVATWGQLTLEGGYASGGPAPGSTVYLFANPDPPGQVFAQWSGDLAGVADPFARNTTLTLPLGPVRLRATYAAAPAWTTTTDAVNGAQIVYFVPPQASGLIFRFHGTGGSGAGQFRGENLTFARDAVAAGYGVIGLDSVDRVNRQWNAVASLDNPDVRNVQAASELLRARGLITAATPVFGTGTSNGGGFVSRVSALLSFRGQAIYIASGIAGVLAQSSAAAIWCIAKNDSNDGVGPAGNQRARENFAAMRARGLPSAFFELQPTPVPPLRFTAIPGINEADSREMYAALRAAAALDATDFLRQDPSTLPAAVIPARLQAFGASIASLLEIAWADHQFYSDADAKVLGFFDARLGRGTRLRTLSAAAETGEVAPDSLASSFGLALSPAPASFSGSFPNELGGTVGFLRDSTGRERPVPLVFVSPFQVNFQVPPGVPPGRASVSFTSAVGVTASGPLEVAAVAPAVFAMNGGGAGVAAAQFLRASLGRQTIEDAVRFDAAAQRWIAAPVDLGPETDQVYVLLYATGIRGRSSLAAVRLTAGGAELPVSYAGPQGQVPGFDQVNALLPRALAGRGTVTLRLTVDGRPANVVEIAVR